MSILQSTTTQIPATDTAPAHTHTTHMLDGKYGPHLLELPCVYCDLPRDFPRTEVVSLSPTPSAPDAIDLNRPGITIGVPFQMPRWPDPFVDEVARLKMRGMDVHVVPPAKSDPLFSDLLSRLMAERQAQREFNIPVPSINEPPAYFAGPWPPHL